MTVTLSIELVLMQLRIFRIMSTAGLPLKWLWDGAAIR